MANSPLTLLVIAVATIQVALATYNYYPPCDPPHRPDYGGYGPIRDSYPVGSMIKFYCNTGYRRYGASHSVCRYSRRSYWAYDPPVCKPITCPNLDDPRYGSVKVSDYTFNSTANYSCDSGYRLVGYEQRRCLYGYWTGKAPVCQKTTMCPIRGDPAYGSIRATGYTPGSTIHYRCNKGFKLVGEAWQKCLRTRYWSGEEPICKSIIQCPDLDDPPYGTVNVTSNTPGSTAHYECDEGFELVGDAYRECLYNGYWSGEEPVCKRVIVCPDLDDPPNGTVNMTDNTPGSTAHYECDEGFELVGDAYRECLYNGYWSGEEPVCERIIVCPDLDDPPNGTVNMTDNTPGSTAHYECDEGFELVGDAYRECLDNGYWSGEEPVCERVIVCPDLDDPPYGTVNMTDNIPGSTAHYECNEGFKLVGDTYRECLDNGYWSGEEPVCKRIIVCPDLDDPPYGTVSMTDNIPGSTAHYECDKGFKLVGEAYRKCLYNGYWSGDEPVCKRIITICPHLPPPRYGKVDVRGYTPTSKAYYSCDEGYELVGPEYRQCRYDGSWYGNAPVCRPKNIVCPNLDAPRYGRVYVRSYTPSSVAYYSCSRGYRLRGLQYRKCQRDGSWYGTAPTCERVNYYHRG